MFLPPSLPPSHLNSSKANPMLTLRSTCPRDVINRMPLWNIVTMSMRPHHCKSTKMYIMCSGCSNELQNHEENGYGLDLGLLIILRFLVRYTWRTGLIGNSNHLRPV